MAESDKPPEPSTEQKPTPNQQAIEDLSWDIPFARTIGNFFIREGKAVKNGWVAVLIIAGIVFWFTRSYTQDGVDAKISDLNSNFNVQILDLKSQIADAKQDRDKYFQAYQSWQAAAAGMFPNQPPEKQLALLASEIALMTNQISRFSSGLAKNTELELSTEYVRLGDGQNKVKNAFSIYNPSDFGVDGVVLQLNVHGVPADSINIKTTDEYEVSKDWPQNEPTWYVNAYTYRVDVTQDPTNQIVIFQIGSIRAKSSRFLEVKGGLPTSSSAEIKITGHSTNNWEILEASNATTVIFPAMMIPSIKAAPLGNPVTNIIIFGNVSNYPVEQSGKFNHYREKFY